MAIDFDSCIDGLVAHIAAFRSVEVIDVYSTSSKAKSISFIQADMSATLGSELENICDSLSSAFVIRYSGFGGMGQTSSISPHLRLSKLQKDG